MYVQRSSVPTLLSCKNTFTIGNELVSKSYVDNSQKWSTSFGGTCTGNLQRFLIWNGNTTSIADLSQSAIATQYILPYNCILQGISWQIAGASSATRFSVYSSGTIVGLPFALGTATSLSSGYTEISIPTMNAGAALQIVFQNTGSPPSCMMQIYFRSI